MRVSTITAGLGLAVLALASGMTLAQGTKGEGAAPQTPPQRAAPPQPQIRPQPQARSQPDWAAPPTYTTLNLQAGFEPDPRTIQVQAGGDFDAAALGGACIGMVNGRAPDVDINYRAGSFPLNIYARSSADTVLVFNDPQGRWHCNDDTHGLNPAISFPRPESGNYNIWVGVIGGAAPATLSITELDMPAR
jgi:hypothetical protein